MRRPITATDAYLAEISGKLDELLEILRPEPPAAPEPAEPVAGPERVTVTEPEPVEPAKEPPARRAAKKAPAGGKRSGRRGQVRGT